MVINVGINGFGRIGRIVARTCLENPDVQLSAINDPVISLEYICYLLKFDSTHGKLKGVVTQSGSDVLVGDHHIKVYHEKLPPDVPWIRAGVQYVVESSGMFTNYDKARGHLESKNVKRAIVTAPSADIPMIILTVNDHNLSKDVRVISCASSTLYCLAPIIKVLEDKYGVEEGFVTSIHAMTPSLKPLDGLCLRGRHWRDHRSIHQNIIPAATGACKALGKIIPQVKDKLSGLAFRVPIVNVSVLDLTVRLKSSTNLQEIVKFVRAAGETNMKNIIKVSSEESVSSDFMGESSSCIFDETTSIQLKSNYFKIICWYENEYSYACRVVDTIIFCENQDRLESKPQLTNSLKNLQPNVLRKKGREHVADDDERNGESKPMVILGRRTNRFELPVVKSLTNRPISTKILASATDPSLHIQKDTKKRNEFFKIWNDTNENSNPAPKQNRNAIFQSCMVFASNKIESSTKARLEKVKQEFSKMVNITEDLLKKTQSNQSSIRSQSIDEVKSMTISNLEIIDDFKNDFRREMCGDCNSLVSSKITITPRTNNARDEPVCSTNKDRSSIYGNINKENKLNTIIDCTTNTDSNQNTKIFTSKTFTTVENVTEDLRIQERGCEFKKLLPKTSSRDYIPCVSYEDDSGIESKNSIEVAENNEDNEDNEEAETFLTKFANNKIDEFNNAVHLEKKVFRNYTKCDWNKEINNLKIMDEELRKRNIILMGKPFVTEDTICTDEEIKMTFERNKSQKTDLPSQFLEGLQYSIDATTVSRETSRCFSPQNSITTESNSPDHTKQDIYDKLDSASNSDSNNSFEIKGRKSQIIQITDLTNSLEDLANLDKICRIIEISDELSDNLFSGLDDNKDELKNNKWSFKDFCDRIKLDQFCDRVFSGRK